MSIGGLIAVLGGLLLLVLGKVCLDLASKQAQGWLFDLCFVVLRVARRRLPAALRVAWHDEELVPELKYILFDKYANDPVVGLYKGFRFAVGHVRGAKRLARESGAERGRGIPRDGIFVLRVRRHWACLLRVLAQTVGIVIGAFLVSRLVSGVADSFWLVQSLVWYVAIVAVLRLAWNMLEWWNDVIIVTDKRFVITSGIIVRKTSMIPITEVTDMSYMRPVVGQLLDYGTLRMESAGQKQGLEKIEYLPRPEEVFGTVSGLIFGEKKQPRFHMLEPPRRSRRRVVPRSISHVAWSLRTRSVIFGVSCRCANEAPVGRVVLPQTSRCHRSLVADSSCHRRVVCDSARRCLVGLGGRA